MKLYSDQEIIKGIQSSESYAVKFLAEEYFPMINFYISKNHGNEEDAKDIFQDALFIIVQKIQNGDFDVHGALSTYLFALCKHLWLGELDRKKAAKNYEIRRSADPTEVDFSEKGDNALYESIFRKCFNEMDEVSQKILKMYWMDISPLNIAEELGYSYGYIRKKKSECAKELKNKILNHPDFKELGTNLNLK